MLAPAAAAILCACAAPAKKAVPPPPSKKEAAPKVSPEDAKKVERLYYKAVGAYSDNDMPAALVILDEISSIEPAYRPAAELREKIKRTSSGGARPAQP